MKILNGVAILAAVLEGRGGKLFVMGVLMAIRARSKLHFVEGVLPGRGMAFVAGNGGMFAFKRIVRGCVLLYTKLRRLPALDGVAFRALSLACPRLELAFMGVRRMATHALGKGQRLLEIASGVAFATADLHMRAQQRVFCFRMVELHRRAHFFPTGRRVAGFARPLE